ncbi:small subunit ribosomal protein S14 [Isoptericola jiangsuensis]|uniref:Small ribosomal subunit protein uS14 n=1 Tax=Isoptericola jiangsuensis TaxID=548579 RepID=A0A2A9EYN3_9MICO|nr:30S ribosomal protein S14 [Isoptericola jiangsuensis]PFG43340.1 small subunit ribosomal protein S14 [Isoptericola jiangsuensis]
MAKSSKIAANARRAEVVARHAARRAVLKKIVASPTSSPEERAAAVMALQRQPRDASRVRLRHRDVVDGRPRGYHRTFGLSRLRLRAMAHRGELPGVTTSSW